MHFFLALQGLIFVITYANLSLSLFTGSRIFVNEQPTTLTTVERQTNGVSLGGHYSPKTCTARSKVAIIIPYRDRASHLNIFLRHMHKFLRFQEIDYTIFVVELVMHQLFIPLYLKEMAE